MKTQRQLFFILVIVIIFFTFSPLQIASAIRFDAVPSINQELITTAAYIDEETISSIVHSSNSIPVTKEDQLYYYSFNIGQADCHLIELNGHYMLVDTGLSNISADSKNENYLNVTEVRQFLQAKGIKKIDYLIITHYDGDHIGGMWELLGYHTKTKQDDIKVNKFISRRHTKETLQIMKQFYSPETTSYTQYRNYLKLINAVFINKGYQKPFNISFTKKEDVSPIKDTYEKAKQLKSSWLSPVQGECLYFANKKVTLQFLSLTDSFITNGNLKSASYSACSNNDSLVFKLTYGKKSILFTGDIDKEACMKIIDYTKKQKDISLQSNILKVPHHGVNSNFYSERLNLNFIETVAPDYSIITCAKYFIPTAKQCSLSNETIKFMGNIYRTDMIGEKSIAICSILTRKGTIQFKKLALSNQQYQLQYTNSWEFPITQIVAPEKLKIKIGISKKISATPVCTINSKYYAPTISLLTFESEDPSIATVNERGYIDGKKAGTTNIIIRALDGTLIQTFCQIVVTDYMNDVRTDEQNGYADISSISTNFENYLQRKKGNKKKES